MCIRARLYTERRKNPRRRSGAGKNGLFCGVGRDDLLGTCENSGEVLDLARNDELGRLAVGNLLKSFEALAKVADGKSTKIIIPSELQNLAGLAASLKEVVVDEKDKKEE